MMNARLESYMILQTVSGLLCSASTTYLERTFLAIRVNILDDGRGVEILAEGVVRGPDIIEALKGIYDKRYLEHQQYHIVDKSRCTEYDVTALDIERIAEQDRKASISNPGIVIAVVESQCLQFSLTELWQAHLADCRFKTRSFRDRQSALAWIAENIEQP